MKIILTQEVSGLGSPGDVVEVKDGYGRNYLLPQGFAHRAGPRARRSRSRPSSGPVRPARSATWATPTRSRASSRASRSACQARAGDGGRLFGSVTPAEIVDAVKAAGGPILDRRRLELPGHIKSIGAYPVKVKLHPEVTATFDLNVNKGK